MQPAQGAGGGPPGPGEVTPLSNGRRAGRASARKARAPVRASADDGAAPSPKPEPDASPDADPAARWQPFVHGAPPSGGRARRERAARGVRTRGGGGGAGCRVRSGSGYGARWQAAGARSASMRLSARVSGRVAAHGWAHGAGPRMVRFALGPCLLCPRNGLC